MLGRTAKFLSMGDGNRECKDEEIWTFLTAMAFASGGERGTQSLQHLLTGGKSEQATCPVWLEALPLPPRTKEGNTNLDLCMGAIQRRGMTSNGIEYDNSDRPLIFCEMKWYSDLSYGVTGDPHRNQLIRVIENAVTFQSATHPHQSPGKVHVTLVTPEAFKQRSPASRFYQYKFEHYNHPGNGPARMKFELDSCRLEPYAKNWIYPKDIEFRLAALKLHWVTFEELIEKAPPTELADLVREFHNQFNQTKPSE